MFKPLKSFLTYLQKNTNPGNIFNSVEIENMDPLEDPLHIPKPEPEEIKSTLTESNQTDYENEDQIIFVPSSDANASPDKIIIVDVNLLKKNQVEACNTEANSDINNEPDLDDSLNSATQILSLDANQEGEERSDGSDSGIGPEPPPDLSSVDEKDGLETFCLPSSAPKIICDTISSSLKRRSDTSAESLSGAVSKRPKRGITFDTVTVYYFPRIQGFACVPSQGGCTLGMSARHSLIKKFTLSEHAAEQRRAHRQQLQELNPRSSSSDESDSEDDLSENSGSEVDVESNGFLQPVPARQRRALLKTAGVRKIDASEKDECRIIRSSREFCGCSCRGYCDPDTCFCSQNGIKCQVDRLNFPCGCTRDGCGNVIGRVEFNPGRVRTHFIHTIMRIELEKKQNNSDELDQSCDGSRASWLPQIHRLPILNLQNSDYNNSVIYSHNNVNGEINGPSSSSSNCHIINSTNLHLVRQNNSDSLDLHYAYRDDYPTNSSNLIDHNRLGQSVTDLNYSKYQFNQTPNNNLLYGTHYASSYGTDFPNSSLNYTFHSQNQNYIHSSYPLQSVNLLSQLPSPLLLPETASIPFTNIENNSNNNKKTSNDFINLHPPDTNSPRLDAINDLLENNRYSNITTAYSATEEDPLLTPTDVDNTNSIKSVQTKNENTQIIRVQQEGESKSGNREKSNYNNNDNEINENLSEIIKKSIVETVSA